MRRSEIFLSGVKKKVSTENFVPIKKKKRNLNIRHSYSKKKQLLVISEISAHLLQTISYGSP